MRSALAIAPLLACLSCSTAKAPQGPALAIVQTRHERLEVRMVDGNARFTVRDADGRLLGADLNLDALSHAHPELQGVYQHGLANTAR